MSPAADAARQGRLETVRKVLIELAVRIGQDGEVLERPTRSVQATSKIPHWEEDFRMYSFR